MDEQSIVFIDYENTQSIDFDSIDENIYIKIFVGDDQQKLRVSLIKKTQKLGPRIEWIDVIGKGKNALDFFIAYYLGVLITKHEYAQYYVYSKDKGYDPLIKHLNENDIIISRIETLKNIKGPNIKTKEKARNKKNDNDDYSKIVDNLISIDKRKRPKTHKSLVSHIKTALSNKIGDSDIEKIFKKLINDSIIIQDGNKISYPSL